MDTLQLVLERRADGSIEGELTQTHSGGCLWMALSWLPSVREPERLSARIVFSRDWFGATEQYYLGIYFLRAADAALPERPVWYRIRP
jgi:hypothetical protein